MADKLKMLDVSSIKWENRFRKDLGDIKGLTESIREKGVLQPITVYPDMTLCAGERRLTAARAAGLKVIPALIRDRKDNSELDMREVELFENIHRKDFSWVEEANLIAEIDRLYKAKDVDWSGRKTSQLLGHNNPMNVVRALKLSDAMVEFPGLAECRTQDDALKFIRKLEEKVITNELVSRQKTIQDRGLKTMLEIAAANYIIGDALEGMVEMRSNGSIHFIEVDPPYGVDLPNAKKQEGTDNIVQTYQEVDAVAYPSFIKKVADETFRVAGSNCWMIFWFGPTHFTMVQQTLRSAGWSVDDIPAIWHKHTGQTMQPEIYLARAYEPFFICRKGMPTLAKRGRSNVFDFTPVHGASKYHPTQRPMPLMVELIETFTLPRQIVFCPFLGSGTTLRACYDYGVSGYGFDLNPEYKDKFMLAVEEDTKKLNKPEEKEDD